MPKYTYRGPADTLDVDGKEYKPGEPVVLSEERKTMMELHGHRFDLEAERGQERKEA